MRGIADMLRALRKRRFSMLFSIVTMTSMRDDLRWAVDGPPIGVWTTVNGTADILMQDTLSLLSDGTGFLQRQSVMFGTERFPVKWKHVQPGTLLMSIFFPDDDPDDEPFWQTVRYCNTAVEIDVAGAHVPVLSNLDDEQFWDLAGPIGFVSPASSTRD